MAGKNPELSLQQEYISCVNRVPHGDSYQIHVTPS